MRHLLPQETQDIPDPARPPASLIYISLQPINEDAIDVGIADENTDGCLGHDRLFMAHFNLVCRLLLEKKKRTSGYLLKGTICTLVLSPPRASSIHWIGSKSPLPAD